MEHGGNLTFRTQAEARKDQFNRQAHIAKDLADLALRDIDEALAELDQKQE